MKQLNLQLHLSILVKRGPEASWLKNKFWRVYLVNEDMASYNNFYSVRDGLYKYEAIFTANSLCSFLGGKIPIKIKHKEKVMKCFVGQNRGCLKISKY